MLDKCSIQERWSGVDTMIEHWLEERQALIVQFCEVSGILNKEKHCEGSLQQLQGFCQILVDYVSAGHFEIYYQLLREAEAFEDGSAEIARSLMPKLDSSTGAALDFNDSYATISSDAPLMSLNQRISDLGEVLESRFEIEDRLIEVVHNAHREVVSA